ncbi:MAG: DNA repair protein RecN [Acidiferrobacterales bacterium]
MLSHLFIRNFAIVDQLELTLEKGLSVLTGETGAGKSILIDALSLTLGDRANTSVIRQGAENAEVIANFELATSHDAQQWLHAQELDSDGDCIIRRVIYLEKSSRAYINGRPVPVQQLKELGNLLVDIHGQHEHQSLLKRDTQRQILDDYAGIQAQVVSLSGVYDEIRKLETRISSLKTQSSDQQARVELLKFQINELELLALATGEILKIEQEHKRLANGAEIIEGTQAATYSLYQDEENSVDHSLNQTINKLEHLAQHDAKLGPAIALLNDAAIQIREAADLLSKYSDDLDLDPERLQWLDQRLGTAHDLARKHQVKPDELPEKLEALMLELSDIENADINLEKLESELGQHKKEYLTRANEISSKRADAAASLGKKISSYMGELGMEGGLFEIQLETLADNGFSSKGLERINFYVSANPGQPVQPITKVASGGELSRISLALQVVIASIGRIPTMIFDEVDVGVGGRVAEIVGKLLRELGNSRQVICVTHLAQVAAQGNRHFQVSKRTESDSTQTRIESLPENDRVKEIARMIGGIEISKQTLDHAEDMLNRAAT